ncbi:MAG: N-acetyl-gamma-glutamyl-phosphate reductase, partial [Pseudomonadales bacterium]
PLTREGLLRRDAPIAISALSGYSGGGRKLIERYEARAQSHPNDLWHCRPYSLHLQHKHIPEMTFYAGLKKEPVFLPSVGHFAQGMLVNVPLFKEFLADGVSLQQIHSTLDACYAGETCVVVHPPNSEDELDEGFLEPQTNNGTNRIDIFIFGTDQRILLVSRLDNLGKGASGAAVQNLNLMVGADELRGLTA